MMTRAGTTLVAIAVVVGVLLTGWGLSQMALPEALPFNNGAFRSYLNFILAGTLLIVIGSKVSRRYPVLIGAVVCVGLAIFAGALWPLFVTVWFAMAAAIVGRAIFTLLKIDQDNGKWALNFLSGAGAYGTAVGLLAHVPASYPAIYGAALALPLIFGRRHLRELGTLLGALAAQRSESGIRMDWLQVFIAVVAIVHFSVALMPELGHDALVTHLFVPAHMALRHKWGFDASIYVWAVMPMLGDWIFSIGYMLAGETAARLINLGFIFFLGWMIRDLVLWAGGTVWGAKWAILIFLSTPLTFTESSSLFIESIWASFIVAGTIAVLKICSSNGDRKADLAMAGVLLGCALAAKAVTFTVLPVLLLLLIVRYKFWLRAGSHRGLLIGLVLFLVLGLIPYATSYWVTGSPIFPFFNKLFQSPYYPVENFEAPSIFGKGLTWDALYRITFNSEKYLEGRAGAAGFQWLILCVPSVVALAVSRHRKGLALFLIAILWVATTFNSTAYLRYVFPSFVALAAVIGVAFSLKYADRPALHRLTLIPAGFVVVTLNLLFLNAASFYSDFPLKSLSSDTDRRSYLQERLPIRNAVEAINHLNTGRTPVAVFSSSMTAGLAADGLNPSWYNHRFQSSINAAITERALTDVLIARNIDYVILDESWGTADKRLLIEKATEKLLDLGPITVRTLRREYKFQTELLKSTDFDASGNWTFPEGEVGRSADGVRVSVGSPAYQKVPVTAGRRYLNSVTARCEEKPAQGRLQVNWLDSNSKFIGASIRLFDCALSLTEHSMEAVAAPEAAFAVVYASSHTPAPVVITNNSFRQ